MKYVINVIKARVSQLDIEMSQLAEEINSLQVSLEIQQSKLIDKAEEMVELKQALEGVE